MMIECCSIKTDRMLGALAKRGMSNIPANEEYKTNIWDKRPRAPTSAIEVVFPNTEITHIVI